ncbi:MAG: DUF3393 domain-containing protein [Campylobacterales bacterium]|nr:DUF3393 domain-containing protein [Campylobacterales bacterium]
MHFLKLFSILFTASFLAANNSYTEQIQEFQNFKKTQQSAFNNYLKSQEEAFSNYKKELRVFWNDPKLSNKKEWITYTNDKKTRTDINFEEETITIETIANDKSEAKQKIAIALAKAVTIDTKTAYESDPLEQKLKKIPKPQGLIDKQPDTQPILKNVLFSEDVTQKELLQYVGRNTQEIQVKQEKNNTNYFVKIKLPKDTTYKRSKEYYAEVQLNAKRQNISLHLIFSIIHSESAYNPMARSHVPAYGLMQIVPQTAGIDAYNFLYNEKKLLSGSYLYNSKNNIKLGSAYLHILYFKYLKSIKNPQSRLYCTIAAYNTGAGNVARAFSATNNVASAAKIINQLSPEEVYRRLLKDLKYDEPKEYLKRVTKRIKVYEEIYKQS